MAKTKYPPINNIAEQILFFIVFTIFISFS